MLEVLQFVFESPFRYLGFTWWLMIAVAGLAAISKMRG
jgi:hypothetical protein